MPLPNVRDLTKLVKESNITELVRLLTLWALMSDEEFEYIKNWRDPDDPDRTFADVVNDLHDVKLEWAWKNIIRRIKYLCNHVFDWVADPFFSPDAIYETD